MLFSGVGEGIAWRLANYWRRYRQRRYLRQTFLNWAELVHSLVERIPCERALTRDGASIMHPANRIGLAQLILEIWWEEIYTRSFYEPKPDDMVIDAGANIGLFSLWLARRQPDCHVIAFEPFAENYGCLVENLKGVRNVKLIQAALAGAEGSACIAECGHRSQDHRLSDNGSTVRTHGLPEVLSLAGDRPISLFKCDIEGSERELFQYATTEHLSRVERFAIEYHSYLRRDVVTLLRERLTLTHCLIVGPNNNGSGMLYAILKGKLIPPLLRRCGEGVRRKIRAHAAGDLDSEQALL
jgi:FkbM family methyltransferase